MTKHTISRVSAIIIAFATVFAYTGCKESAILNTNITPAGDSLHIDGVDVPFSVKTVVSHYVTNTYISGLPVTMGAGLISYDPEVGRTEASLFFQVTPGQSSGYVLPDANLIDSIVLVLPYDGFTYGDTANAMDLNYEVYQSIEDFSKSDTLFNDDNKPTDGIMLGSATLDYASLRDSMSIEGKKVMPHLRIPLTQSTILARLSAANYNSYLDFVQSFKALQVKVSNTNGNIIPYYRITDDGTGTSVAKAGIVVYHHAAGSTDLKYDVFGYNPEVTTHYNKVDQNITGSFADTDPSYIYLQSRPGLSLEITTTGIANLSTRIVNKAEIIITEEGTNNVDRAKYVPPFVVFPFVVGNTYLGREMLRNVTDAVFTSSSGTQVSGLGFVNGVGYKVTDNNGKECNQYVMNIPKELQKAINEKREMTLRITGLPNGYPGAFRLKAHKNNPTDPFRIRMNVVYSSL